MSSARSFLLPILALLLISSSSAQYDEEPQQEELVDPLAYLQNPSLNQELPGLSYSYYHQTCPDLDAIINRKVKEWIDEDYTLAASLIRLHFHDCAVRVPTYES